MAILTVRDLGKSAAARMLFQQLSFTVQDGDRIGLIGPNGAGKSTLLRILAAEDAPDQGSVDRRKDAIVGYLPQVDPLEQDATLQRTLLDALKDLPLEEHEPVLRVRKMIRRLGFADPESRIGTLSGGWRKRAALGALLVQEPDCLLMDEPTNHLDLDGIGWLERFLERARFSFIVTTHDRYFLERVTNRIIEIDPRYPTGVLNVRGRYSDFLEQREQVLCSLDHERAALANEVRREVQWLRRGPSARSSKASHRVDQAHRKIDQLSAHTQRGKLVQDVSLSFSASHRQTQDLIVAEGVTKTLGGRLLFSQLDVRILRGTRLGIVGNNATGKTTLLKVLTGDTPPDQGRVQPAYALRHALFDQHRAQLDPSESLRRALAPMGDIVTVPGRPTHVIAWAKRFGFCPDQLSMPLGELSGGEQARVLMATMMREPVDVLFLDEPTNDLDISSIEILEHALVSFPGAVVLITHDRHMLDRVCTDLIGLHGNGHWGTYAGVLQWMEAEQRSRETASEDTPGQLVPRAPTPTPREPPRCVGLTYHEKRELAEIEHEILRAEACLERLDECLNEANLARDHARLHEAFERREEAARRVSDLYARWETLETKSSP